jgi:tRNA dimethylallyltransferase
VYRGLDIGSAKLSVAGRRGIPHHLIDLIEADEELTAGSYSRLGRRTLDDIRNRAKVPIVAGGTGFYLRALLDGLSPAPGRNEDLRKRLAALSRRRSGALHRFLRVRDPGAAARIHPNDHQKLIRTVELSVTGGRPASEIQSRPRESLYGFVVLKLGLQPGRTELYRRLDERSEAMFHSGLLEETRALLAGGLSPDCKALQSLGYKQAVHVLRRGLAREAAISEAQTKTRQYAKRQMTWFRAEAGVHWLQGFGKEEHIQSEALQLSIEFTAAYRKSFNSN